MTEETKTELLKLVRNEIDLGLTFMDTYRLASSADLVARRVHLSGLTSRFDVVHRGTRLGECTLQIPGRHNVLNAAGAMGAAVLLGVPLTEAAAALGTFTGVRRRFGMLLGRRLGRDLRRLLIGRPHAGGWMLGHVHSPLLQFSRVGR